MAISFPRSATGSRRVRSAIVPPPQGLWSKALVPHLLCHLLALLFSLSLPGQVRADISPAGEYQVKAAFILNFANFVEWPGDPPASGTLTIGILGRDASEGAMDSLRGKTVKGRRVVVRHFDDPEEALGVDILFINASERRALPRILKTLRSRPVLTIGDQQGFARAGVMINMVIVRKRVGFEVNTATAKRSGIVISSQLLKLAKEVIEQ